MSKTKKNGARGLNVSAVEMVRIADVNPAIYNPRIMPPEKMRALKASLVKHGMVLNLVVQRRGMVLIGGHQRIAAMRELCAERGWPEPESVPAVVLDVGDAEAKQLNVSLNSIEGEFDPHKLGELFADVFPDMTSDDVLASGFDAGNIEELVAMIRPPEDIAADLESSVGEIGAFAKSITLTLEFSTVEARDKAKELLRAAAESSGEKVGDAVLRMARAHAAAGRKKPAKRRAA